MTPLLILGWLLALLAGIAALARRWEQRARREEIARACHELRGPITAVRLALALGAGEDALSPQRLGALDTELGRATLALDDLSGAAGGGRRRRSACGAGIGRLDRVDLRALLAESILAAQGRAVAGGATISGGWCGQDASVWGDRLRLAQTLGNLLANAIEHGGGDVRVRGELRDGHARITVDDDGRGLPASVAELARRPRAGRGSRGRGLAIAAGIAQAHGGSLAAGPAPRGGRVVLTLPAREFAVLDAGRSG